MTREYVLARECATCRDDDEECPRGMEYLNEEHSPKIKLFFSREEAKRYIYEELGMDEEEVMIIPKEEMLND
jgi:hypothetical protein